MRPDETESCSAKTRRRQSGSVQRNFWTEDAGQPCDRPPEGRASTAILTVTVHGETSAERTCCAWGRASTTKVISAGSGCSRLSTKPRRRQNVHSAQPHVRVSRLGSPSGKLLQSAPTLHLKWETSLKSLATERDDRTPKSRPFHRLTVYVMPSNDQRKQRSDVVALH